MATVNLTSIPLEVAAIWHRLIGKKTRKVVDYITMKH